ncbi:sensor histidine kinase [Clostridium sp. DL1XJH146]
MIEKLRRKFIFITMGSVIFVITTIMLSINIFNYMEVNNKVNGIIDIIIENEGYFPDTNELENYVYNLSAETPFRTRYFTVKINSNNEVIDIYTGKIAAISPEDGVALALQVIESNSSKGYIGVYRYKAVDKDGDKFIVFLDSTELIETLQIFSFNSIVISVIGAVAVILLVVIFSKKVIEPVAESVEKQKQFITDAGHELKTPLAIINASAEVLELEKGDSEWTESIKNQVSRLSDLTTTLVSLARMEEDDTSAIITDFSLSDAITQSVQPFFSLAKSQGKLIFLNIQKDITYKGDEKSIRQLISILLDNAIKYSIDKGEIKVALKKQGRQNIISVSNEADNLKQGNLDVLFDRFYRADASRNSKTGGFGIGLSIAKTIVTANKGKITAKSEDGKSIVITANL